MTDSINNIVTISPMRVHFGLKTGVNETTPGFTDFLKKLATYEGVVTVPALHRQAVRYESIESDVYDRRLMIWRFQDEDSAAVADFHVFPNSVAVVEIKVPPVPYSDPKTLEEQVQVISKGIINRGYQQLYQLLLKIAADLGHHNVMPVSALGIAPYDEARGPYILWIARTLIFRKTQLNDDSRQKLITRWLAETARPADAKDIIEQKKSYSMTWLNYVLIENQSGSQQFRIDTMIIAQYYYAAQDLCNEQLKQAISNAYLKDRLNEVETNLGESRAGARLLQIAFHEHIKHLTRAKRKALEEILASWDYDDLVENTQRMVDVCTAKLQETNHQKRERSSLLTDLLLVSLSFFAVFELCLFLTQFSREMMSRPALDYQDETSSFFLSRIAYVDADIMIVIGILMTTGLVLTYRFIKTR